ncbi:MAG TPA: LysR substrate-binding domain-containing protein [Conexibacter sp.]|jgi:DNA-binding transcriptional LysR family regulator
MDREPSPPLDLRKLRYFVAVAEELHFGRAAERLYIAQPVLSRQIKRLEQELGAELLARTSRNVELTAAGRELLAGARPLLRAAEATQRRVVRAGHGTKTLTVGFGAGNSIALALAAFAALRPDVAVDVRRIYWHDQTAVLLDGRVDVAILDLPVDERGLALVPLHAEPRVAALAATHPLAGRGEISINALVDDPVILHHGASAVWEAFHNVDPRPDGRHPQRGPEVQNLEEKMALIAAGRAVSFLPASVAATQIVPGVAYVPVRDIPPARLSLAWDVCRHSPLVGEFVAAASGGGAREGARADPAVTASREH